MKTKSKRNKPTTGWGTFKRTSLLVALLCFPVYAGVNPDGSYSESLPIEVPAGRNGIQPKLALSYNSNSGNGIVGVGWSLQGLPAITRMNYGNGINYNGGDTYTGPEGRLIDVSASAGLPAGSLYHAENESWSKYEPLGWDGNLLNGGNRCGDAACAWRITDRSGAVSLYGDAGASRVGAIDSSGNAMHGGAVRVWALSRVADLHGNYYEVEYYQNAGQFYPKKITYTLGNWASRFYAVTFDYDQNGRPDKETSFAQLSMVQTNWRLSGISVTYKDSCLILFTCSNTVRNYGLEYDTSGGLIRSRLVRWLEFDAAAQLKARLSFTWNAANAGFSVAGNFNPPYALWNRPGGDSDGQRLIDLNGDGLPDLLRGLHLDGTGYFAAWLNTGNGWVSAPQWNPPVSIWFSANGKKDNEGVEILDINNDGLPDILKYLHDGGTSNYVGAWLNNGNGWSYAPQFNPPYALWNRQGGDSDGQRLVDLNGDGLPDLLRGLHLDGTGYFAAWLNTGNGWVSAPQWNPPVSIWFSANGKKDNEGVQILDINNDGRPDIIKYLHDGGTSNYAGAWLNNGNGWTYAPQFNPPYALWHRPAADPDGQRLIDVNGDGLPDLLRGLHSNGTSYFAAWLNTGNGWVSAPQWNPPVSLRFNGTYTRPVFPPVIVPVKDDEGVEFADVNGDGLVDIIKGLHNGSTYLGAWLNNGNGWAYAPEWNPPCTLGFRVAEKNDNEGVQVLDVNGDGFADVVRGLHDGGPTYYGAWLNNAHHAHLLSRIDSSGGVITAIDYTPARQAGNAICANCAAPGVANNFARYLVTQVTSTGDRDLDDNGSNDSFSTRYEYENGRVSKGSITERASLGFEKIKTTDVNSGNYKIDTYRQDKPFQRQAVASRNYLADGTLVSEEISAALQQYLCDENGCILDAANTPHPSLPKQMRPIGESLQRQYINGFLALVTKSEVTAFDTYGNKLESKTTKQLGSDIVEEHAYATYLNSLGDASHVRAIGLPVTSKKCLGDCSIFNTSEDKEFYYDDQPIAHTGLRNLVTRIKAKTGLQTLTKNLSYYPNGNLQSESGDAPGIKTLTYDTDYSQYITETRITIAGKPDQVTTQKVDPRYGTVIENTDLNGTKTTVDLDAQGRIIGERVRNASGKLLRRVSYEDHLTGNANPADHYVVQCAHRKANLLDNEFTDKSCSYTYVDAMNRKYLQIASALNGTVETYSAIHTIYDRQGRLTKASSPYFKDTTSSIGTPAQYGETIYDYYGRAWKQIGVDSKTIETNILYNGGNRITTQTIALDGITTESSTDVTGVVRETTQAKGTAQENTVSYIYYTNGLPWQINAPQGLTILEYYHDTKQQKSIIDPNIGKTEYIYETNIASPAFGKLLTETRPAPNGGGTVTVTHEYNDAHGRLTRQSYSSGDEVLFTYDETDLDFGRNKLTTTEYKSQGYSYKQRYSYNELGQAVQSITDITHASQMLCANANELPCHAVVSTEYDEQGRKKKVIYPDLKETSLSYFGGSPLVASIAHDGKTYANYDGYDLRGKITGIHYGNGARTQFSYDAVIGLLSNLKTFDSQNRPIQDLDYTFSEARNITAIDDNIVTNASYAYEYDGLNRIKKATRSDGKVFNYAFDVKGNLTLKENRTQHFYANSTKLEYSDLTSTTGTIRTNFIWSDSGNLLQRNSGSEAINYTWSAQNYLIESTRVGGSLNGTKTTNVYAGEGNRFLRVYEQPGKQKVKTWSIAGVEIRETFSGTIRDNIQVTKYIYGIDGGRIASITGNPGELIVSATSSYQFTMAKFYNGQTVGGLAAKMPHFFMGCYYFVAESYAGRRIPVLLSLMIFILLLLVLLSRERRETLSLREFSKRFLAFAMAGAFFAVNCTSGKHDPAFSNPTYYAQIPNLYTGLPAGISYYHANHLGSATVVTESTGLEKIRVHYTTYGEIDQNLSGRWDHSTSTLVHDADQSKDAYLSVAFTGQSYSIEEEMYFYGARHYDPTIGIFVSADSIVDSGTDNLGYNRYLYVAGNPIKYSDPTGHNIFDDIGDFFSDVADWWSDNVYKPMRDWWDKNIGSPIKDWIGEDAFNVLAGIAGGLVPMYGMIRASDAGGPLNVFLYFVSAGTTGLLNMVGCVGCYVNFSYTYKEGFGFGVGWSVTGEAGMGVSMGAMYRERGAFQGWNGTMGVGYQNSSGMNVGLSFIAGKNATGIFVAAGAKDSTGAIGVGIGQVCTRDGNCSNTYSGYSAVDYSRVLNTGYNTKDKYKTSGHKDGDGRPQQISHGSEGDELTVSLDIGGYGLNSNLATTIFGERGVLGVVLQMAGLKPASVLHDYLVVSRKPDMATWVGRAYFVGSMLPSFAMATPLADMNFRTNQGYQQFRYGL